MEASHIGTRILFLALMVLAVAISGMAKAKDDNGSLCGMSTDELFECKPAVAAGAAIPPPPTTKCCAALTHANATCFCTFKTNKYLPLFGINSTRAVQLPSKCDPTLIVPC